MRLPIAISLVLFSAVCTWAQHAIQPARLGVFGIGFTHITDTGATVVFTTSLPAKPAVEVRDETRHIQTVEGKEGEIHRIELSGLQAGKTYAVSIRATAGDHVAVGESQMTAGLRQTRFDRFEHRTYLGVSHADDITIIKDLGVGMVRVSPTWDAVEPAPGKFDEQRVQREIDFAAQLKAAGVEPLVLLCYGNAWAKTFTNQQMTWRHRAFGPPDRLEDWDRYVRKVMTSMKGTARYYEAWNEPDAGYLASGVPAEAAGAKATIPRSELYHRNNDYWLGDRYVPLAMAVRQAADTIDPTVSVLGPSWNHDYHATRGEICFSRGLHRYLQSYSFHNYVSAPHSYEAWEAATHGKYMSTSDALLTKYNAKMPIAVTEWGIQSYENPKAEAGFASRADAQTFLVKSVFYYFDLERVSMLILHQMGYDDAWSLLWKNADGTAKKMPTYDTYRWLCHTFNRKLYHRLPVSTDGGDAVRVYALMLPEENTIYLAAWQNHPAVDNKLIAADAKDVTLRVEKLPGGEWTRDWLDVTGKVIKSDTVLTIEPRTVLRTTLPEAPADRESPLLIWRLTRQRAAN